MHFFVTMPLWLAVILWIMKSLAEKGAKTTVIQRTITAPDGRQATFVVPIDEPASISIARMYPGGVEQYPQASINRTVTINASPCSPPKPDHPVWGKVLFGCVGLIGIAMICSWFSDNSSYSRALDPRPSSYVMPAQSTVSPLEATSTWAPPTLHNSPINLERVRLKTGANMRASGSKDGRVIRLVNQGSVLVKFGEMNGWTQVGSLDAHSPEGWIANSTIGSVTP